MARATAAASGEPETAAPFKGFKIAQLRRILSILEEQQDAIQEAWKNHFQG